VKHNRGNKSWSPVFSGHNSWHTVRRTEYRPYKPS